MCWMVLFVHGRDDALLPFSSFACGQCCTPCEKMRRDHSTSSSVGFQAQLIECLLLPYHLCCVLWHPWHPWTRLLANPCPCRHSAYLQQLVTLHLMLTLSSQTSGALSVVLLVMSCCRVSVCDSSGECWEVSGLYIADASAFPTASGVNPMITVYGLSYLVASGLASKWKSGHKAASAH